MLSAEQNDRITRTGRTRRRARCCAAIGSRRRWSTSFPATGR